MATGVRRLALRFTAPAAGLAAMIAFALLYQLEPESYYQAFFNIGVTPNQYPFGDFGGDLESVASMPCCHLSGPCAWRGVLRQLRRVPPSGSHRDDCGQGAASRACGASSDEVRDVRGRALNRWQFR